MLQIQQAQNRSGPLVDERATAATEILLELTQHNDVLHRLAVECHAMQTCAIVLGSGAVPASLVLPVLQLICILCTSTSNVELSAATVVQNQKKFLSHAANSQASSGASSLIRLIRDPHAEVQRMALRTYTTVTINDSDNTYRLAEGLVVSLFSAASADDETVRRDAVAQLETLFSGDLGEEGCFDLGQKCGLGEVFELANLYACLGGGPEGSLQRYRCVAQPGALLRTGSELGSDRVSEELVAGQVVTALEETVNCDGVRRIRCNHGWCSVTAASGDPVLIAEEEEEVDISVQLPPALYPSLLVVRKRAILALRRLLRTEQDTDYVEVLVKLVVTGDPAIAETALFTLADICLDTRLRGSVALFMSVELLYQLASGSRDTNGRTYARLALLRIVSDSTRNANALLALQGHRLLLECATGGLWIDASRAIAQVLWMAPDPSSPGVTQALIAGGGLQSVLRLATQSIAAEDSLLVAKALSTLCQEPQFQSEVLLVRSDHDVTHGHASAIRTLVTLERAAHTQSIGLHDAYAEVKREVWQALSSLTAHTPNHVRLKTEGVVTLCAERCAASAAGSEVDRLAMQVLQSLDPRALSTLQARTSSLTPQDGPTANQPPHYWAQQNVKEQLVEVEVQRGTREWVMLEQMMNSNMHQHGSRFGQVPGSGGDPRSFPLVRAVRIQNISLWRDYAHRKEAMMSKYGDALGHSEANEWLRSRPILTATHPQVSGLCERRVNEQYLFHGTDVATAETLKQQGFDARVSSLVGMFGGGSYFAEK